ncbi:MULTISPECIES: ABC transporter ATP-binding protein [unclassified Undibacterium]|uniref:ABC transporter ATP-binding protein n=1 Tax=unclassified Undibacterium TaxID=2630295 RepID=UPI003C2DAB2C
MSTLLHVRGLRKSFGPRRLLDIAELNIEQSHAYVLTGMNGSGKSTLLRILSGLESAQTDEVRYLDKVTTFSPYPRELRNDIVYVHQHPVMFSGTVAENIAYGLRLRKAENIEKQVALAMCWAGILHLSDHDARYLSGGEKQRVALARVKVLEPRLLLLDEPTANLDGEAREQVIALIPTLTQAGSSVVVVCHDRELIALPDMQRLKLRDGKLEHRTAGA